MARISRCILTVCALTVPAGLASQNLPPPMAYWNFDDNVEDQSGSGHHGTLMGDPGYSDDVPARLGVGRSLVLSGDGTATDYVDLSVHVDNFTDLEEGTISAWFKTPGVGVDTILAASDSLDASSELRLILEGGEVWLDVREEGGVDPAIGGALESPSGFNDDTWHHVAVTVEIPAMATMYIDGAFVGSTDEPFFSTVTELDTMSIGRNVDSSNANGQWFFDGLIDDLAIWDEPLSCEEIVALSNGASPLGGEVGDAQCLLAAPTGLVAIGLDAAVTLNWNDGLEPDLAEYNVYRSLTPGGPYELVDSVTESQFRDDGLTNGTTYYYTVTAVAANGSESLMSEEAQATPEAAEELPAPFAYWPLNEGDGQTVFDLSGNRFHGTLGSDPDAEDVNDPQWVEGVEDANGVERDVVLDLGGDGNPMWVDLSPHAPAFAELEEGTIAAWVKWPGGDVLDTVLAASDSGDGSSELRFFYDTRPFGGLEAGLRFDIREGGADTFFQLSTPTDPGDDTWRHVAVTVDADGVTVLYIDGVPELVGEEVGFFSAVNDLDQMALGRNVDSTGSQWHFLGQLSEVVVWDEPLSAGQMAALANGAEVPTGGGDPLPPAAPTGLVAVAEDAHVDLHWDENTEGDLLGYFVYRSLRAGDPGGRVSDITRVARFTDSGLINGTTYFYTVTAVDTGDNESGRSAEVEATPMAGLDLTPPAAPTGLLASGLDAAVALNWNDNTETDLAGYSVLRSETAGGPYTPIATGVAESMYSDDGVVNDTTYYYVVTASDGAGNESDPSEEVEVTPMEVTLPTPFAYWPLNEGEGQFVEDLGPNGFDGFLGSTPDEDLDDPMWVEGVEDANGVEREVVLDLGGDGSPQWVDLSEHVEDFALLEEGTISAWVKWPGGDVLDTVMAASDSFDPSSELRFFYDTRPFGGVGPGLRYDIREDGVDEVFQLSTPTDPGDDTWHHVAVTVDIEGATAIYIDGFLELADREVGFFSAVSNLNTLYLGRNVDSTGSQWHFLGQLSDVAVWDVPLTSGAIALLAAGASPLGGAGGEEAVFKRGDVDGDGGLNLTDAVAELDHLFVGSFQPTCMDTLDFDDDGNPSITDAIAILTHLFSGGPPPPAPGKEECGPDPTPDEVSCESYPGCGG